MAQPARYQSFKFCLGEWCGIPGSEILHQIVRIIFDGSRVIYVVKDPSGSKFEVLEQFCLTESELRDVQLKSGMWIYADAQAKLTRLLSL